MMYKSYDRKFGKYPFFSLVTVIILLIVSMLTAGCAAIQPGLPGVARAIDPGVADKVGVTMVSPGEIEHAIEFVRMSSAYVETYTKPGVGTVISWMRDGQKVFLFILESGGVRRIMPSGLLAGLDRMQGMKDMLIRDGWKVGPVAPPVLMWIEAAASSMTSIWLFPVLPNMDLDKFMQGEQIQS
jgi:hypothetical protein